MIMENVRHFISKIIDNVGDFLVNIFSLLPEMNSDLMAEMLF